ncbi:hypothetical protein E2C01_000237 [Portunus trituberculatus]|uniref:Uncharacterized protein n=1 Tax=Portunus trituberculatus TaxID=210409 RepID=A0A5B7CDK4_PORTR|nr:hypothetical protein [Portunus trituberculatus]
MSRRHWHSSVLSVSSLHHYAPSTCPLSLPSSFPPRAVGGGGEGLLALQPPPAKSTHRAAFGIHVSSGELV